MKEESNTRMRWWFVRPDKIRSEDKAEVVVSYQPTARKGLGSFTFGGNGNGIWLCILDSSTAHGMGIVFTA